MKYLTPQERQLLEESYDTKEFVEATPERYAIAEGLVADGRAVFEWIRTYEDEEFEWVDYQVLQRTPLGELALRCDAAMRMVSV
jgi:hypothetical protein